MYGEQIRDILWVNVFLCELEYRFLSIPALQTESPPPLSLDTHITLTTVEPLLKDTPEIRTPLY